MTGARFLLFIGLFVTVLVPTTLAAQPARLPATAAVLVADAKVGGLAPGNAASVDDVVAREVWFMAKVGRLSPAETDALAHEAQKTLRRWGARVDNTMLGESLRRELTPLLKDISREAWEKFDAEQIRLEARRKHAAILAQVAELDEAIVLLKEQRTMVVERLTKLTAIEDSWEPQNRNPPLIAAQRLPADVSAGDLGGLNIPEQQLAAVLWPAQFVAYKQFKACTVPQVIFVKNGGNPVIIGQHARLEEHSRTLRIQLDRLVDTADSICKLSETQRQKLTLAGRIDIERFCERYLALDAIDDQDPISKVARLAVLGGTAHATLGDPASNYQKALSARLTEVQKKKLADTETERHAFRRHSLVEAAVVGFERSATMTAAQCAALAQSLNDATSECDAAPDWRIECLRMIAGVPEETLHPIFSGEQRAAVQRQLAQIDAVLRQIEAEGSSKVAVFRGLQGAIKLEFQANRLRIDVE